VEQLSQELRQWYGAQRVRVGVVAYTDVEPVRPTRRRKQEPPALPVRVAAFTESLQDVRSFLDTLQPQGGGDTPEVSCILCRRRHCSHTSVACRRTCWLAWR
jgi:hypothetical protein